MSKSTSTATKVAVPQIDNEIVGTLIQMLKLKNHRICLHSFQVANYAVSIAAQMRLPKEEIERIRMAAVLHDIGKSFQYRQQIPHEIAGERIARRILDSLPTGFTFTDEEKALICLAVRGHCRRHEHMKPIEELFYESDKRSRMCLSCMAEKKCNWNEEEKNMEIII